jgi:hypothetical protein
LWFLIGALIAYPFHAVALWSNNSTPNASSQNVSLNSTYEPKENILFSSPAILNYPDFEQWEAKFGGQEKTLESYRGFNSGSLGGSCVEFSKRYTGQGGSWGIGGRNLSLNGTHELGAVVIFSYPHTAVQVDETDTQIKIIESNYSAKNTIGTRWIDKTDETIKGFHIFNN